jgi:hypothetical protein
MICTRLALAALATVYFVGALSLEAAEPIACTTPTFSDAKSGEQEWRYQPNQICHPIPKFDYTPDGRAIMIKRYPFFPTQDYCQFRKYSYFENKHGVEHFQKCCKLKREPGDILSEDQKEILREWGQPDYLRGPFKSTRGDIVIEWGYHALNHLFQFVDRTMVYEGPLTDQERTAIVYGAPRETVVMQLEPNIRRETWIYRPWFLTNRERIFSFTNGRLTYQQETP